MNSSKVHFTAEAEPGKPFTDIKVGLKLQLAQQEDGSWTCNREDDGSVVCQVPAAAAASLAAQQQQQQFGGDVGVPTAAVRSVKRCQDNSAAAVSIQVRISFSAQPQGQKERQGARGWVCSRAAVLVLDWATRMGQLH